MNNKNLGKKIREKRIKNNLTIKDLASKIKISNSMLSQIENGVANPSLTTLRLISNELDTPMFTFLEENIENKNDTMIVRKSERIKIIKGQSESNKFDLGYDLLTPDLNGSLQMCEMSLGPYQYSHIELNMHDAEEVAVCIKESVELHLEDRVILLKNGDSVRIEKNTKHRWKNPTEKKCSVIFALTPPCF